MPASELNALSVLSARRLLITPEALDQIKAKSSATKSSAAKSSAAGAAGAQEANS